MNVHVANTQFDARPRPKADRRAKHSRRIVIVDGYSTGRELVRELLTRDAECLHLRSSLELPAPVAKSFDPSPYHFDLGFLGGAQSTAALIAPLNPDAVVAGSEWGVTFAEDVAHQLGLPTNRQATLVARRDKFEMIEAVRRAGLRVADQASVANAAEAHEFAERHGKWPIVLKPMTSAGSDGVTICRSHEDIDRGFARDFGRVNFMGCLNDRLLVQSYLPGDQFIVNTVSHQGRHYVTDVWSMAVSLDGSDIVPRGIALMDPTDARAAAMVDYTLGVLTALGIENGAAHTELKWTPEGPALIETGARVMGAAMDLPSYRAADMSCQASVYARVLTASPTELEVLLKARHYERRRHITKLLFNFKESAVVGGTSGLSRLGDLRSFHAHYRPLAEGDRVTKTADWLARGGVVYLIHDDPTVIAADIETFCGLERAGALYELTPVA